MWTNEIAGMDYICGFFIILTKIMFFSYNKALVLFREPLAVRFFTE